MARIIVENETNPELRATVYNAADADDEPYWGYKCSQCFGYNSDRGNFEDTMMAAEIHVDRADCRPA